MRGTSRRGISCMSLMTICSAVPFDADARAISGRPVALVEGVARGGGPESIASYYSVATSGSLVYLPGFSARAAPSGLIWIDRTGQIEPLTAEPRQYHNVRVAPSGTRVAVDTANANDSDIWIYDLERDTMTRLTFDEAPDSHPLWTPDGSRVVFWSERNGGGLFWKAADGTGDAELLLQRDAALRPYAWSTDGRLVVEADQLSPASPGPDGQLDSTGIAILNIEGERVLESVLDTEFNEREPAVSLDGRWLAYNSNESGTQAVYVRPFPDVDAGKWQVSAGSAFDPGWSPDGRELFYRSPGTE